VGISYFRFMTDKHKKLQTQIRMTPENRERFRETAEAMGLSAEELVMAGLDALSRRNQPTNKELLAMLKERLG
jgi:hypothetical protein